MKIHIPSPCRPAAAILLALILRGAAVASVESELAGNQCLVCHQAVNQELYGKPLYASDELEHDVHLSKGILCQDCHGGDAGLADAEASMAPAKGFVGSPTSQAVPRFCGKCHDDATYMVKFNPGLPVDQVQKYYTSRHGERLQQGDEKVAQCVSCHGAHGMYEVQNIKSPVYHFNVVNTCAKCHADPKYMAGYNIPTDQYKKNVGSVHGVALLERHDRGSPACNDCHGNHGAVPPGVNSVANVCSVCHALNGQYFSASPHKAAFDQNNWPECTQCHGDHDVRSATDSMLGGEPPSVCITCHKASDSDQGYVAAVDMKKAIQQLEDVHARATREYEDARNKGMEVGEIEITLRDVRQELIKARTLIHTLDTARVTAEIDKGSAGAAKAREMAQAAIAEYAFRREGLGLSTLIITILAILLYVKIRRISARREGP